MNAVVFHEFGGLDVLQFEEVPDPQPGPGEVVLDILAAALNHLDVDIREGVSRFPVEPPFILGVEVVGRISALGEGVTGWEIGDRVLPYLLDTCGDCVYCQTGRATLCLSPGFISFSTSGGYAEKLACSMRHLIRVPDALSDEAAVATLYRRHKAVLSTIISRVVHNDFDVDELLQEVFIELWNRADHYDETKGKALGWIVTLARRWTWTR